MRGAHPAGAGLVRVSVQKLVAGRLGFNAEEAGTGRAAAYFLFGGFAHRLHLQLQAQCNARQWVVAVEHDVFRVNFCHGVQAGAGCIGVATFG